MAYAMATAMAMIARIPTTTYRVHGLPVQSSIPHRPLAARGESLASHRDGRGAPPARRDEREYREYLSEEQRSRRGCIARRMQPDFHHGLLAWPGFAPTPAGRASGEDWSSGGSQFPARRDRLFWGIGLADQPHLSRIRVRRVF